jgi:adenylate kinase family enzyme
MRVLISGGPGAGCTSTAKLIGAKLGLPIFDSDLFFHKPTDPPFQEQYSLDERRQLITAALSASSDWILSGSIATWDLDLPTIHFGVFLDTPKEERLRRLELRERERFGSRIEVGGDLHTENKNFMEWASGYEERSGSGRNKITDRVFLIQRCDYFIQINHFLCLDEVTSEICSILANPEVHQDRGGNSG